MQELNQRLVQTLVVSADERRVLLGQHKCGEFAGRYTGLIGSPADGESPARAARRLGRELCGIVIGALELRAVFEFREEGSEFVVDEYEYYCESWTGEPVESARMRPVWFRLDAIPYAEMPADDAIWYPRILAGERLRGSFSFAADGTTLLRHRCLAANP